MKSEIKCNCTGPCNGVSVCEWAKQREIKLNDELKEANEELKVLSHVLNFKVNFGKFKGEKYSILFTSQFNYLKWLHEKSFLKGDVLDYYNIRQKVLRIEAEISHLLRDKFD
jgi:uncharacterized protein (DUF3820 family)